MFISLFQLAMREACKYVEEKLATKVFMLTCSVNSIYLYYLSRIMMAGPVNGLHSISLKFRAQLGLPYEICCYDFSR
jgi:hypothetical protein